MQTDFYPPRRTGVVFSVILIVACAAAAVWNLERATQSPIGPRFAGSLLLFTVFALPVPLAGYRLYSLLRSRYSLYTGSLRLTWGLRVEELPLGEINWVRTEADFTRRLPMPLLRWPGALVGVRRLDGRRRIEFLAAGRRGLILIETPRRIFAISPEDPAAFMRAFQRIAEIGTIDPVVGESVRPTAVVGSVWESRSARWLAAAAGLLAAVFAAWVLAGVQPQAGLRYPLGETGRFVNGSQLLLMPVLNGLYFLADLLLGLFFFRREDTRPLAYILWVSSLLASLFFFTAVGLLVR